MKFAVLAAVSLCLAAPAFADGLAGIYQGSILAPHGNYGIQAEFKTDYPTISGNLTLNFPNNPDYRLPFTNGSYNPLQGTLVFFVDSFVGEHAVVVNCDVKERTLLGCKWQSLLNGESYDFSLAKTPGEAAIPAEKLAGAYSGKLMTDTTEYDLVATLNSMLIQRETNGQPQPAILGSLSYTRPAGAESAVRITMGISDGIYDAANGLLALQLSTPQQKPAILATCHATQADGSVTLKCTWKSLVNGKQFEFTLTQDTSKYCPSKKLD